MVKLFNANHTSYFVFLPLFTLVDKLSLYDFLSFLVPGFLAFEWAKFIYVAAGMPLIVVSVAYTDVELGLAALCVSFFAGLAIHRLTFWLVRLHWYRRLVYPPAGVVVQQSLSLQPLLPALKELCLEKCGRPLFAEDGEMAPEFFNSVYYGLEAADKISSVKGFQSIYFFLRNLFTLCLVAIPAMLAVQLCLYAGTGPAAPVIWLAIGVTVVVAGLCIPLARFNRQKMMDRLFWTYYSLQPDTAKT